ncbi:DUF4157 domain-containing protein [Dyella choica]|uniref:eCIS core domain-containing protein n=1 Tax=Dyella choica TaxID=1927959 RepID=UPI0018AD3ECF|nr:DUF4157 domain-containing protein [Dyella choica]
MNHRGSHIVTQGNRPAITNANLLQRKCQCGNLSSFGGPCRTCQLQRRSAGAAAAPAVPPIVHDVLHSPGRPLDATTRAFMEPRFGQDFSQVRVHSDAEAQASAHAVSAHAYTVGNHIVFGGGQYAPERPTGQRLLAHELAHVVQQSSMPCTTHPLTVDPDDSPYEQSADATADAVLSGRPVPANSSASTALIASRAPATLRLQRSGYADLKNLAYDKMIGGIHSARDGMRNGLMRLIDKYIPEALRSTAAGIVDIGIDVIDILITLVMAVLGIIVGFTEGIVGMIEGLITMVYAIIKFLYDLIAGIFTDFDAASSDLKAFLNAIKNLPAAVQKLVTSWLEDFKKASSERQSAMIGELTGQIIAIIATFAVAAGRAGTVAKVGGTTADTVATIGDATGAVGDATATASRARPVLKVIQGGAQGSESTAARASAATSGTQPVIGNTALKIAPAAEPAAPPLRLVPPLPAEAAPVAKAAPALAAASSTTPKIAAPLAVAAATATKVSDPKKNSCDDATGLTREDPIAMRWFKVREDDYYPKRIALQGQVYGRDDPGNPRKLPLGEPIGVPPKYWPRPGKIMQLLPSERGSKADDFRAALTRYGYDWTGLQADHVQDLDWGGPDEFVNLWPLSSDANLSAGTRQNLTQKISYCETPSGPHVVDQSLADFKKAPDHYGRYFRIDRVER